MKRTGLQTAVNSLLDLAIPAACYSCRRVLQRGHFDWPLCQSCHERMVRLLDRPACPRCGRNVGPYGACPACNKKRRPFKRVVRVGPYLPPLAALIRRLKYQQAHYALPLLGSLLLKALDRHEMHGQVDLITAVPLHWWRYWQRQFNQAALLAREVQRRDPRWREVPLQRVLVRTRYTPAQVHLSAEDRIRNVARAFEVSRPKLVKGRRILLIDDVMTTGATAENCTRALLKAGAAEVTVAVLAVANDPEAGFSSDA